MKELLAGCIGLLGLAACKKEEAAPIGEAERKAVQKSAPGLVADADKGAGGRKQAAPRPKQEKKPEHPVAKVVGGQPGFVVSPFNKQIVDVRGVPAGTLVLDPTYPTEEKRLFRVPESTSNPKPS
ncbi:hypothetical protein KBB96_02925 [Luteolibacter ambystomatis]|uniref:Uncharacterized protein n=1 Tax=Luteolibacter ambystomatis TaxID=2824561 RepID=A0A975PFX8_9BACT|nr:hypothetical protein [Luteolibacter ambystomatis]QUE51851.1 hypothetical protein KBB96_02925 [Luteolibacter ambystomatis]